MNYYAISALINFVTSLFIITFIIKTTRMKNPVASAFALFALAVAFWSFNYFLWQMSTQAPNALLYLRLSKLCAIWIPPTFFAFTTVLLGAGNQYRRVKGVFYFISAVLSLVCFHPQFLSSVGPVGDFMFWGKPGMIFHLFFLFFAFVIVLCHILIFLAIQRTEERTRKLQLIYVFIGTLIGFLGGTTNFFLYYGIVIKPYGNILVSVYVATVAYAIIKHQLLDIRVVIKKTLFYSILTILTTAIYFSVVYTIHALFISGDSATGLSKVNALGILIVALTFKPLELLINRFLQMRIFKGTIGEISEQKERLQLELERRQRLKSVGILAAGMVHEIRNPLTSLRTFAEYLPSKYQDPDFRDKFSRITIQETDRIKKIADNLLLFAKPAEPDKRKCDVSVIIQEIADLLSSDLLKRNVDFQFEPNVCFVNVDPEQAKQALLNVMMNAIESMDGQGGTLQVQINTRGNYGTISIKDNGCGIDSDKIPFLFDPFYTDKDGGTGLGLPITHSLIERNKGRIEIFSAKGQGSEFRIYLPRAS